MKVKSIVDVEGGYGLNDLLWGEAFFVVRRINKKYLGKQLLDELEIIFGEEPNIADINEYLSSEFDEWDFYARHMFIADLNNFDELLEYANKLNYLDAYDAIKAKESWESLMSKYRWHKIRDLFTEFRLKEVMGVNYGD